MEEKPFRPNIGAVLRNPEGLILMAERIGRRGQWQFPQGGVDEGETLTEALWRELGEELGLDPPDRYCAICAVGPAVKYRFPKEMKSRITKHWAGQEQTLFLIDYGGTDADFALDAHHKPEFQAIRWVTLERALALSWPPKRHVLEACIEAWAEHF